MRHYDIEMLNLQLFAYDPTAQPVNYTGSSDLSAEMKTYYDKNLINEASPKLVHEQFGQKRPIPKNGGKTVEFRKYHPLVKADKPLTEGVTPDGQKLVVSTVTATVQQYGDFVPLTDMLLLTAIDKNLLEAVKLLGKQAGVTMDTVVRNVLNSGTNVMYASSWSGTTETTHSVRYTLTSNCLLTVLEVKKAVRALKRKNAPAFPDGYYVCITHTDALFDLMNDPKWEDAYKYTNPENLYKGEIGRIAGCRFVESTEAKIFRGADLLSTARNMTVGTGGVSAGKTVPVAETPTSDLVGRYVLIGTTKTKITAINTSASPKTITVEDNVTASANAVIYPGEGGAQGIAVYSNLFIAEGAYGVTDIEGGGLETIIKQPTDPLNQRSTAGWKGVKTAEILIEDYLLRLESGSTYSAYADAN